jgi:hypothetical protein
MTQKAPTETYNLVALIYMIYLQTLSDMKFKMCLPSLPYEEEN